MIESYANCYLYMTIPISNAVVAAHLMNRKKEVFENKKNKYFMVIDIGSKTTEVSLV